MTMPHEYMDGYGEWNLHSYHNSDLYNDPDWIASDADYQLPLLSAVGRGPEGDGVNVVRVEDGDGSWHLEFFNTATGESVERTPDMSCPRLVATWPEHAWQEGEMGHLHIDYVQGGVLLDSYDVPLAPGSHGSRMYLSAGAMESRPDKTYSTTVSDLIHYGLAQWQGKPAPRPGDIVAFQVDDDGERKLAFGTVEAVEGDFAVFTSRTEIAIPAPRIGGNGNWIVGGEDTGLPSKGDRGDDGMNAVVRIGNVEALPPGRASATIDVDSETNTYTLNLGIPEGAAGRAIDVQGGIWTAETLPPYDDTPVNTAFVVHDGDRQFDLYIRGAIPVLAEDGGPWTVVEDWQGRPGTGTHLLLAPYLMDRDIGSVTRISSAELSSAFSPCDYMSDGDIVIDTEMSVGILGSSEDGSGDYTVETKGSIAVRWGNIEDRPSIPFGSIGNLVQTVDGVRVSARVLDMSGRVTGDNRNSTEVRNMFRFQASGKTDDGANRNGVLSSLPAITPIDYSEDPLCHYTVEADFDGSFSDVRNISAVYLKYGDRAQHGSGSDIAKYDIGAVARWNNIAYKPFESVDESGLLKIENGMLGCDAPENACVSIDGGSTSRFFSMNEVHGGWELEALTDRQEIETSWDGTADEFAALYPDTRTTPAFIFDWLAVRSSFPTSLKSDATAQAVFGCNLADEVTVGMFSTTDSGTPGSVKFHGNIRVDGGKPLFVFASYSQTHATFGAFPPDGKYRVQGTGSTEIVASDGFSLKSLNYNVVPWSGDALLTTDMLDESASNGAVYIGDNGKLMASVPSGPAEATMRAKGPYLLVNADNQVEPATEMQRTETISPTVNTDRSYVSDMFNGLDGVLNKIYSKVGITDSTRKANLKEAITGMLTAAGAVSTFSNMFQYAYIFNRADMEWQVFEFFGKSGWGIIAYVENDMLTMFIAPQVSSTNYYIDMDSMENNTDVYNTGNTQQNDKVIVIASDSYKSTSTLPTTLSEVSAASSASAAIAEFSKERIVYQDAIVTTDNIQINDIGPMPYAVYNKNGKLFAAPPEPISTEYIRSLFGK